MAQTVISRVFALPSAPVPGRPASSSRRLGTPVPSRPRYIVGGRGLAGASETSRSKRAASSPSRSA